MNEMVEDGELITTDEGEPVPDHMHILRHVRRSENYTKPGSFIKTFISTDYIAGMHNHFPFS